MQDVRRTLENFVNYSPPPCDLQTFLMFFQHPTWEPTGGMVCAHLVRVKPQFYSVIQTGKESVSRETSIDFLKVYIKVTSRLLCFCHFLFTFCTCINFKMLEQYLFNKIR